jgi:pimeloyl-ACP methyl ester carboxylesterase
MVTEADLELSDGRTLHFYDTGGGDGRLAVFWRHGTPNIGAPPEPLFAADRLGIRWVSYDRPGYGGSTPHRGRDVASLRAAAEGRAAKESYEASGAEYDPEFTPADGHISVLNSGAAALDWMASEVRRPGG